MGGARSAFGGGGVTVIARSDSDEAIRIASAVTFPDCFAEPVTGRAGARPVGWQ